MPNKKIIRRKEKEKKSKRPYDDLTYFITIFAICIIFLIFTPAPLYLILVIAGVLIAALILPRVKTFKGYVYSIFSWIFGITAILILVTYAVKAKPPFVIGDNLVLTEVHILPGLYMKPITIFMYSFFLWFAFSLYSSGSLKRFMNMLPEIRRIIYVIAWWGALASGFELVYHLVVWTAALAVQGLQNPDVIVNPWPWSAHAPINIVFSAKIVVLIFALSCFTIDYLKRIDRLTGE
ncbi:MAG: hypothetical protein NWF08_06150 [Candidatus Bathyarchaeota archaeon]|nr:hypothetical protein [Candidatus Bathyarchaeota archaeon]